MLQRLGVLNLYESNLLSKWLDWEQKVFKTIKNAPRCAK